jgi:hypothetical protein
LYYIGIGYCNFSLWEWDINQRNGDLLALAVGIHEWNFNSGRRRLASNIQAIITDRALVHF